MDLREILNFLFAHQIPTDHDINLSNVLVGPEWLSITILPEHLKDMAKQKLVLLKQDVEDLYEQKKIFPQRRQFLHEGIDNIIKFMYNKDDSGMIPKFREEMQKIDLKRGENFLKVFPELKDLYV